jgi:homoserine kinase type II
MGAESIFILQHGYGPVDFYNLKTHKLLGFFATRQQAEEAISAYIDLPGFRDQPDGYSITEVPVVP